MEKIDTAAQDRLDMERLAGGDDMGLNALMERHAGPLFQFLFRSLNDEEDANDLAQETFVRVYKHRDAYDGSKFTTWLYTIASNLARSEFRRRRRHPNVSLEANRAEDGNCFADTLTSNAGLPNEDLEHAEKQLAVRSAVNSLPDDLRKATILCEWEEFTVAEAAQILNTSRKSVESRLYRARHRLRQKLGKWLNEDVESKMLT
jgi:RNA polymerase sigma-70 factor (ECF subfamily)